MNTTNTSLKAKSIGNTLKETRKKHGLSIEEVSLATKIKPKFIEAIEESRYEVFDSKVFVKGFIKNYAKFLNLDPEKLLALYRREYENEDKFNRNVQKPDEKKQISIINQFFANPRYINFSIIGLIVLLVTIYLGNQLFAVTAPPKLTLSNPVELTGQESGASYEFSTTEDRIILEGATSPNSLLVINGNILATDPFDNFVSEEIPLPNKVNKIKITSTNQFGRESSILLTVNRILPEEDVTSMQAVIKALDNTTLEVTRDSNPVLNRNLVKNESFNVDATSELIIILSDPESIEVKVNDNIYKLEVGKNIWTLRDGVINFRVEN